MAALYCLKLIINVHQIKSINEWASLIINKTQKQRKGLGIAMERACYRPPGWGRGALEGVAFSHIPANTVYPGYM